MAETRAGPGKGLSPASRPAHIRTHSQLASCGNCGTRAARLAAGPYLHQVY